MKWMRMLFVALLVLGLAAPVMAQVNNDSERPGSVLVFQKFIRGTVDGQPKSSFEISVVCPAGRSCPEFTDAVKLKALWICPGRQEERFKRICKATDFELFTTVKGTLWFNPENSTAALSPTGSPPSPIRVPFVPAPPCPRGFLVVWAIDTLDRPIHFNGLIGNAILRDSAVSASAYNAVPIQAVANVTSGSPLGLAANDSLPFDGVTYARVSGNIFGTVRYEKTDTISVRTDLTLLTLDVRANRPNLPTFVPLNFYNENERPISTFVEFICWVEKRLTRIDVNLNSGFGGLGAQKGLVESTATASQQNTDFPFQLFDATLLGIIETKESNAGIYAAYAYNLFHDGVGVSTRLCHNAGSACPLP